jgi:hypothetical protein
MFPEDTGVSRAPMSPVGPLAARESSRDRMNDRQQVTHAIDDIVRAGREQQLRCCLTASRSSGRLTVASALPGTNTLDLSVTTGDKPKDVMEATLHLERPELGIQENPRLMQHVGPGRYRLEGPELAVAGPWRVRIELLVSDFEKQSADFLVIVGSASGTHLH